MRQDKKFNEEWFSKWKQIKKIEPHYVRVYDMEGEEVGEPIIDRIDIVFENDDRIRIQACDYNESLFQDKEEDEPKPFPYIEIKMQKWKEVNPEGEVEKKEDDEK